MGLLIARLQPRCPVLYKGEPVIAGASYAARFWPCRATTHHSPRRGPASEVPRTREDVLGRDSGDSLRVNLWVISSNTPNREREEILVELRLYPAIFIKKPLT